MAGNSTISITFKINGEDKTFQVLSKDADGLRKVMQSTLVESDKLKTSLINWSASVQAIQATSQAIAGLNNAFQSVIAQGASFGKAMREVNTLAGKSGKEFDAMKDQVADLSKTIPLAREELAHGLYQVISNGVPEDNWISFLEKSAKAAVGGLSDLGETVTVTSTLIKNYGLSWEQAGAIQDKIQLTAKYGVTTFEQLAQALPSVAGSAAQLGVTMDELMAVFATTTGVTGNTAEVSTQLGAVLKALIAPSTEAAKAAEAMGIKFDAAAIKQAGGLDNFLKTLDVSIKEYAAKTGELSETIYGNLFGSARALRILTSLTGEQAEKFTQNIQVMTDSAGTIDGAFEEMTKTGEAHAQMLKNQLAAFSDFAAKIAGGAAPYVSLAANMTMVVANGATMVKSFKAAGTAVVSFNKKLMLSVADHVANAAATGHDTAMLRLYRTTTNSATRATIALRMAMQALLIATGVGIAIVALTAIISALAGKSEDASESVEGLDDATDAYKEAAAQAKVSMDKEIRSLKELMDSNQDTTVAVAKLNEQYGEIFGTHKTAADWYDTLTQKSQIYVKQLGYEAQARKLAETIAEKEIQKQMNAEAMADMRSKGEDKTMSYGAVGGGNSGYVQTVALGEVETSGYKELREANEKLDAELSELYGKVDIANNKIQEFSKQLKTSGDSTAPVVTKLNVTGMTYNEISDAIDRNEKALKALKPTQETERKQLVAQNAELNARKKYLDKIYGLEKSTGKKKVAVADPKTYEELSNNIEIYKKKLTGENTEEQRQIREKIAGWEATKEAIGLVLKEAERPLSLKSLEDIDKELNYQRARRQVVTAENIAGVDAEIKKLEDLKAAMELKAHVPVPIESITTYKQLNTELAYYNSLMETATDTERTSIQAQINALTELKKKWDNVLAELKKPGEISTLNTIEDLDEAVTYYQALQKRASGEEIYNIQKVIAALEKKRDAMTRGSRITGMQTEVSDISGMSGKQMRVEVKAIGFEGLKSRIKELQAMLNDFDHPVTANQRKDIEALIGVYSKWQRQMANSFDTVKDGWGAIKNMNSTVLSLTETLQGDGSAWEKLSAVVDGFITLYESLRAIIGIIEMFTTATQAHTAAKAAESAAVTAEAQAEVAAGAQKIASNTAVTASQFGLATANTAAAGSGAASAMASIPYVGPILAIAALASVIAAIMSIPKFASGGIAYGPTLGLFGEYAGASNNPEVVAPLDKLQGIIGSDDSPKVVRFKIKGRYLEGILEDEQNRTRR